MYAPLYLIVLISFAATWITLRKWIRKAPEIGLLGFDMNKLDGLKWQRWAGWIKCNQHHFSNSFRFLSADLLEGMTL